ncbi:hypothetical protein LBMAG53_24680 [Planctomycetota bacterium]|nr:hypothetical protein LBMAG53_24680 [Planctomycetota bacterium]
MTWSDTFVPYGGGRKAAVGGLSDAGLLDRMQRYKRQVAKRYRVLDASQIERSLPKGQLWISPKLDGELWFLVRRGGDLALCAYNGRVLHGIPLLKRLAETLQSAGDFLVAGELVAPIGGGRPRSHHLATAFADEKHAGILAFHPFDLVEEAGVDCQQLPYDQRLARLRQWFGDEGTIATVVGDAATAATHYREWVAAGRHEGLVVRSEQNLTFKIKPHFSIDAVVVAYGERLVGDGVRQLRELAVAVIRDDGSYQILGTVGGGFSEEDRIAWLSRLEAILAASSFRMANSEGTLSRFVRPEIVIEIRCSDLLVSDGSDLPIRRMALAWEPTGWKPVGEQVTAALLHPVFLRERTDKRADAADTGLGQLTSRVQLEDTVMATGATGGQATVVKREVWTKETKGLVAVRKYVLIQPAESGARSDWPPLVLYTTDFSPGRADPLQTGLRTAANRAVADRQISEWIEENIKKGWVPAGALDAAAAPAATAAPAAAASPAATAAPAAATDSAGSDTVPEKPKKAAKKPKA